MEQSCQIRSAPVLQGPRPVEDGRNVSRRCKRCLLGNRARPDRLKTAEMCNGVVKNEARFLGKSIRKSIVKKHSKKTCAH